MNPIPVNHPCPPHRHHQPIKMALGDGDDLSRRPTREKEGKYPVMCGDQIRDVLTSLTLSFLMPSAGDFFKSEFEDMSPAEKFAVRPATNALVPALSGRGSNLTSAPLSPSHTCMPQDPQVILGLFAVFFPFGLLGVAFAAGWVGQ